VAKWQWQAGKVWRSPFGIPNPHKGQVWAPKYGPPWSVHHHNGYPNRSD